MTDYNDDNEWGNLGDFDANDSKAASRASNRLRAKQPEWLKNNRKANVLHNDPSIASNLGKLAWSKAERLQKHLVQVQKSKEHGAYKKSNEDAIKIARAKMKSSIMTPFGEFQSFKEFNEIYPDINVRDNMNRLKCHLYYYTIDGPGDVSYEDVFNTPYGSHKSLSILWNLAKESNDEVACSVSESKFWFKKMKNKLPDAYFKTREAKREWLLENSDSNRVSDPKKK